MNWRPPRSQHRRKGHLPTLSLHTVLKLLIHVHGHEILGLKLLVRRHRVSVELLVGQILLVVVLIWTQDAVYCSGVIGVVVDVAEIVPQNCIKCVVAHVGNAVSHIVNAVSHVGNKVGVLHIVITVHSVRVDI